MSEDKNTNPGFDENSEEKKTKPSFVEITLDKNSEEKVSRWSKIKDHVKRNEDRYVSFAAGAVTSAVLFGLHVYLNGNGKTTINGDVVENVGGGNANSNIENVTAINSPITIDQTTNVINNFGGHMTKIVRCVETGEIFESVTKAADNAGVARTLMSKHINGHSAHIDNRTYEILGLSTQPQK